jgi:hypothetical protein
MFFSSSKYLFDLLELISVFDLKTQLFVFQRLDMNQVYTVDSIVKWQIVLNHNIFWFKAQINERKNCIVWFVFTFAFQNMINDQHIYFLTCQKCVNHSLFIQKTIYMFTKWLTRIFLNKKVIFTVIIFTRLYLCI